MPNTGDWGNQIILTLRSDGERRHKKWCVNYDDNYCEVFSGKCIGSAFCDHYKNKFYDGESVFRPIVFPLPEPVPSGLGKRFVWCEHYRLAGFNEKLNGQTVLVKKTPHSFRFGTVVAEDFKIISIEYDGGIHKYDRLTVYRNGAIYVYEETTLEERI